MQQGAVVEKLSIIIPTMQKDIEVLNMLIKELDDDTCVDEIILIDNSTKGFEHNFSKVKVIVPKRNLFVNPSWNLGVKKAKNNYIGILNDDLLLPCNYCKQMLEFILNNKNAGLIGLDSGTIYGMPKEEFNTYPENTEINFSEITDTYLTGQWGSAIFGKKGNFYKIPEKLKIWCGDNYLLFKNIQKGKKNYKVANANIKHLGSLSVDKKSDKINSILKQDIYYYAKIDEKYKNHHMYQKPVSFLQKVFSIKDENDRRALRLFGFKIKFKKMEV